MIVLACIAYLVIGFLVAYFARQYFGDGSIPVAIALIYLVAWPVLIPLMLFVMLLEWEI